MKRSTLIVATIVTPLLLTGCATESSHSITPPQTASVQQPYHGTKTKIAIGKFQNRSGYGNGIFSDGIDHLGNQSKTILMTHLQQTGRFTVLDRSNLSEISTEAGFAKQKQTLAGAQFVITGDITGFGRKEVGDRQLFGILGSAKQQIAYAKVSLNVIDVNSAEVVYSAQGAGEYILSNREVVGFGGTAGYDATLNGKVIDLAVRDAVDQLVKGVESGAWKTN